MDSIQQLTEKDLLCSCRQPPAGIRDFSRHPKSANPIFLDFGSKLTHSSKSSVTLVLQDEWIDIPQDPGRLFACDVLDIFFYNKKVSLC